MAYDCDVLVIGAGIVGLSTAYAITRAAPGARVVVLEEQGARPRPPPDRPEQRRDPQRHLLPPRLPEGPLRAPGLGGDGQVLPRPRHPHEVTGKLIVATDRAELPRLHSLIQRGREHGIPVRELGPGQIAQYEPEVSGLAAIHIGADPGITDFGAVARCLATLATEAGAHIVYGSEVTAIGRRAGRVAVRVSSGGGMGAGRIAGGVARTPVDTGRGAGRASADTGRVAGEVSRAPADTERVPGEAGCAPTDAERAFGDAPHTPADALRAHLRPRLLRPRLLRHGLPRPRPDQLRRSALRPDRAPGGRPPGMRIVPFRGSCPTAPSPTTS
ncbi:L-2-hydroxyglutarate oxidase OS=Streptomyces rimosus subsp. rimosus (strain ATCC / DSM 40260/ JCM 4667 / NRRL 2234) OX=1265868 GN=lhgO PE=3 SV=1 [Streptomyces rimosus subsp. rimosus]